MKWGKKDGAWRAQRGEIGVRISPATIITDGTQSEPLALSEGFQIAWRTGSGGWESSRIVPTIEEAKATAEELLETMSRAEELSAQLVRARRAAHGERQARLDALTDEQKAIRRLFNHYRTWSPMDRLEARRVRPDLLPVLDMFDKLIAEEAQSK